MVALRKLGHSTALATPQTVAGQPPPCSPSCPKRAPEFKARHKALARMPLHDKPSHNNKESHAVKTPTPPTGVPAHLDVGRRQRKGGQGKAQQLSGGELAGQKVLPEVGRQPEEGGEEVGGGFQVQPRQQLHAKQVEGCLRGVGVQICILGGRVFL